MAISERIEITVNGFLRIGWDVLTVAALALLAAAIQISFVPAPALIRALSSLLLLLFLPGYAFVTALYPYEGPIVSNSKSGFFRRFEKGSPGEVRGLVRLVLSLGSSVVLASLLGVVLGMTPVGISTAPLAAGLSGGTLVCSVVAAVRRQSLPFSERYSPSIASTLRAIAPRFGGMGYSGGLVRALVVVSLLLSLGSVAYITAVPQKGETPTEFYLFGDEQTERAAAELTADGYPNTVRSDGRVSLTVGITSHESRSTNFSVLVALDRVERGGNSSTVTARSELTRFGTTLSPGEQWERRYSKAPSMQGSELRLTHLLYRDEVPPEPTVENAYRATHVWVTVAEPTNSSAEA